MSSPRTRVLAAVLAAVVLLVPVAGCGGGSKKASTRTDDPTAFVTKLSAAMAKERTAKLDLELGSSLSATAYVDYAPSGTSMSLKMNTGAETVNVVLAGGVMYLQQTKGQKYLKIDKSDPALGSLLGQISSIGPKATFDNLKPGIKKVVDRGTETIDGAELDHYVLNVDTAKISSVFGVPASTAKLPKTVTYDVWVDDDFLLHRLTMTVSGQHLLLKASNWGKPVTIKAPPASQVMTR